MNLDAIKSRVGAQSPATLERLTPSVRKLLTEDVPKLIEIAEAAWVFTQGRFHPTAHPSMYPAEQKLKQLFGIEQ